MYIFKNLNLHYNQYGLFIPLKKCKIYIYMFVYVQNVSN